MNLWRIIAASFIAAILSLSVSASPLLADYNVTVTSAASSGGSWSGASPDVWTPSASGSNVSVTEIQARLATKGVTITTAGGGAETGDLTISTPLTWTGNTLTLTAARDIQINAVLKSNNSSLTMTTTSGTVRCGFASGGDFAGRVDFFQADGTTLRSGSGFLTINSADYTVITALVDLQGMQGSLAGKYALGANIDATATKRWNSYTGFLPVGDSVTPFTGIFDGLGHTINRLYIQKISTSDNYAGLFGYVTGALRNVGLALGSVSGNSSGGYNYSGGLAGYMNVGNISNAYSTGGVFGSTSSRGNYSGGLVGYLVGNISNAYSSGFVSGSGSHNYSGGLAGYLDGGYISNAYNSSSVFGSAITSDNDTGGLVGYHAGGSISNAYNSGSVSGSSTNRMNRSGGLVGYFFGSPVKSYNSGFVTGSAVNSSLNYTSGLVGDGFGSNSFSDIETSGVTSNGDRTTAQMKSLATFTNAGWDISEAAGSGSVWRMVDGITYPLLRVFSQYDVYVRNCTPGNYDNGSACTPCAAGSYQPAGSQTACLPAPAGFFTAAGAAAPTACSPGEYQSLTGQSSCIQCPIGKYQPATGQIACLDAPAGFMTPSPGTATLPTPCPAGTFQSSPGSNSCTACQAGTVQPATGQTACVAIPKAAGSMVVDQSTSPTTLYAAIDTEGVYKSPDDGASWAAANGTTPNNITNLRVKALVRSSTGVLYVTTYGSGLFKSSDNAGSWSGCGGAGSGLGNQNVVSLTIDGSGKLYAGSEAGVFVSSDGCASWTAINGGLPN